MSSNAHSRDSLSPNDRWLEQVSLFLVDKGDWRGAVRLVERWAGTGEPSRAALLAQARAFLNLMLMDRAWVRLKDVGERWPRDRTAELLTAEMFVERGWPVRARKILEPLDKSSPQVAELLVVASQPPRQPPSNAREIQESGAPDERLHLAERFMAAGSFLRAKSILERLRRQPGPWIPRVEDLLWGVDGEFAKEDGDPAELARQLAPDLSTLDVDDSSGNIEHTWSEVTATGIAQEEDSDSPDLAFPALFRRVDALREAYTTEEVTSVSHLASVGELLHREETEEAEFPDQIQEFNPDSRSADTQIMMVIPKTSDGPVHTRKEDPDPLRETLNLRDYLSDMGMGTSDLDSDADEVDLEEEDEDLVILTRRETAPAEPTEEVTLNQPVEVVEPDLSPPPLQPLPASAQASIGSFDPVTVGEPAPPTRPRARPVPAQDDESEEIRPLGGFNARPRFIALLLALLVMAVLTVNLGLQLAERVGGGRVVAQTRQVVASGAYGQLLAEEATLEARVTSGDSPQAHLAASYALVELILWAEYTGDPGRLDNANRALAAAREEGGAERIRALAEGVRAYHQGDLQSAVRAVDGQGGAEESLLRARVAADQGDAAGARDHAQQAVATSSSARYWFGRAQICHVTGDDACADSALKEALRLSPRDPRAGLLRLIVDGEDLGPKERVKLLRPFLEDAEALPPRVAGLGYLAQAGNLGRMGRDDAEARALDKALSLDPGNPELQYWLSARHLWEGKTLQAEVVTERVLAARPHDRLAMQARLELLLTLDRLEAARVLVGNTEGLLLARLLLAEGKPEEAARIAQGVLSKAPDDAMAAYLLGLAYGELGRSVDAEPLLLKAHKQLAESDDPYDRLHAARAQASAVLFGHQGQADRAREAEVAEAEVLSLLARYYDAAGEDNRAAGYHERAAKLAPESARVQYYRGLFYTDQPGGQQKQHVAWDAYLELKPTGERAQKVRERMGRR